MENLTITLGEENSAFVKRVVSEGTYASASDYLNALVANARKNRRQLHIEMLLNEGLASESIEATDEMWEDIHRRFDENHPHIVEERHRENTESP